MIVYPLIVIHLIIRHYNYSQAVVVPMGELMHGVMSIAPQLTSKILDMYIRKIA